MLLQHDLSPPVRFQLKMKCDLSHDKAQGLSIPRAVVGLKADESGNGIQKAINEARVLLKCD
jgi:hypothetical protein